MPPRVCPCLSPPPNLTCSPIDNIEPGEPARMPKIMFITSDFAVAGALEADDFAEVERMGFRSVINNRPDGEDTAQLTARQGEALARDAGLDYRFIPTTKLDVFCDTVVGPMSQALATLPGPVLAHCKSGMRTAIVWAAIQAADRDVDEVLAELRAAGIELEAVREELAAIAGRADTRRAA